MLTFILVGATALIALTAGSAALLYAHLTGRVRKPVTAGAIVASMLLGAGLLAGRFADIETFGHLSLPIGVFFLLAGSIDGLIVLCPRRAPGSGARLR